MIRLVSDSFFFCYSVHSLLWRKWPTSFPGHFSLLMKLVAVKTLGTRLVNDVNVYKRIFGIWKQGCVSALLVCVSIAQDHILIRRKNPIDLWKHGQRVFKVTQQNKKNCLVLFWFDFTVKIIFSPLYDKILFQESS